MTYSTFPIYRLFGTCYEESIFLRDLGPYRSLSAFASGTLESCQNLHAPFLTGCSTRMHPTVPGFLHLFGKAVPETHVIILPTSR